MLTPQANNLNNLGQKPFHNINRPENLIVESVGERSNIFSSVLRQTIIQPYPYWHPKTIRAWFTKKYTACIKVI